MRLSHTATIIGIIMFRLELSLANCFYPGCFVPHLLKKSEAGGKSAPHFMHEDEVFAN